MHVLKAIAKVPRETVVGIVSYIGDVFLYVSGGMVISYLMTNDKVLLWPMTGVYAVSLVLRLIARREERKLKEIE